MTITIFGTPNCKFCTYIKDILDMVTSDIKTESITNLPFKSAKQPVLLIDDTYIHKYSNLHDILNQINDTEHLTEKISVDKIYDIILHKIYSIDEDDDNWINIIVNLMEISDIKSHVKNGYQLAHHIISSNNEKMIKAFIKKNIFNLETYKTKNHVINNTSFKISIPGNQSLLHIAAQNNKELYLKIKKLIRDEPDDIGILASEYYDNSNNSTFLGKINKLMQNKYGISFEYGKIIDDVYEDISIKKNIIELLSKQQSIKPNSMHDHGVVLSNEPIIKQLLNNLNEKFNLNLENKVYEVYVFTAEYDLNTNKKLDIHKDNSIITINWNLEIADELDGTEIVFVDSNKTVKPHRDQLLIHHGKVDHYVTPLKQGHRKNLIIWLK